MDATGPAGAGNGTGLRILRTGRRVFEGTAAHIRDPLARAQRGRYLADLVEPYGLRLDEPEPEGGHSYGEMAEALIRDLVPAEEPVDLIVLTFAVPDVRPGRATATYLSHVCPGAPLAFAVCDQGSAAAFTGLRLAAEYARTGGCRRILLVVLEQADLPYRPPVPVALPDRHAAVALLCDDAGTVHVRAPRQYPDVAPDRVAALLDSGIAEELAGSRGTGVTLVLSAQLSRVAGAGWRCATLAGDRAGVRVAPAGAPHTGVWWELAGWLAADAGGTGTGGGAGGADAGGGRTAVLADYDPIVRQLCLSVVTAA